MAFKFKLPRVGSPTTNIVPNVAADKMEAFYSNDAWKEDQGVLKCSTATGAVPTTSSFTSITQEGVSDAYEVIVNIGNV